MENMIKTIDKFYYGQELFYTTENDCVELKSLTVLSVNVERGEMILGGNQEYPQIIISRDRCEARIRTGYNSSSNINYITEDAVEAKKISSVHIIKETKRTISEYEEKIKQCWDIIRDMNKNL